MGKKISSDVLCYFGGYDVGTATTSVAITQQVDALDPTALGDAAERVLAGLRKDEITWGGLFDDGTSMDAAAAALVPTGTSVFSVLLGSGTGAVAYSGTAFNLQGKAVASVAELVKYEAVLKPDLSLGRGLVLPAKTTITGSASQGTLDNSALSTAGGEWHVHVFGYTGAGTGTLALQDSSTGTAWTNLGTVVGLNARTSSRTTFTGTVNRYTRVIGTLAGTNITYATVFIRS